MFFGLFSLAFSFFALFLRVWHLQIFNGKRWRLFSEANRVEIKKIPAKRGKILDRNGVILSKTQPTFQIVAYKNKLSETPEESIEQLQRWISIPSADRIIQRIDKARKYDRILIKKKLNFDEVSQFLTNQYRYPGFDVVVEPNRFYPFGELGSHFLGYLTEIGERDLEKLKLDPESTYQLGDIWGVSGVEKAYESILKGINGSVPVIEDAFGRELGEEYNSDLLPSFRAQEPVPGFDLVLTIDARLQKVAHEVFKHPSGSLVAIDPRNGDVLALVSKPDFSSQEFVGGISSEYWAKLQKNKLNPLYDRSIKGQYPPASTFKIITGAAALEEKVTDTKEKIFCPGYYRVGREVKRCWNRKGHGWVDFKRALKQSCDVYFYEVGLRLGIDKIAEYARKFGFGSKTNIELSSESSGLVPTSEWKKKIYKQPWVRGETLSVAIGQGYLQTTPLQVAQSYAAISRGGEVFPPRLALRSQTDEGIVRNEYFSGDSRQISVTSETIKAIHNSLISVVNEPGGTAYYPVRSQKVKIAGKTGTAQVVSFKSGIQIDDHAWFVGYAPAEDPEIVVAAILEYGGHGGSAAGPVVKKVIEEYWSLNHAAESSE